MVEVVFDGTFAATADDQDVFDAAGKGFFDDVLDGGFIYDG